MFSENGRSDDVGFQRIVPRHVDGRHGRSMEFVVQIHRGYDDQWIERPINDRQSLQTH